MKVAVAIIVKDECADILPWICWYFNLKASALIVYDDSSTDGTFELVRDASDVRDVRLHRVPPSIDLYTQRQQQCYIRTIAEYGDEFDWIGFLDADEYLALPEGQDLPSFLDRPEDVGAVAINWCNYGSGGYVLKPRMPPFYAYNTHYDRGDAINRHVKTFVRPRRWVQKWHNPHFFDVHPLRYDDPMGRPVSWSAVFGITREEARWDGAKLMHYQCRSMEHFVERIRKRPDIPAHPSLWAAYDHSEVEDNSPRRQYDHVAVIMRSVVRASVARVIHSCSEPYRQNSSRLAAKPNFGPVPDRPFPASEHVPSHQPSLQIRRVITHFGTTLERLPHTPRIGGGAGIGAQGNDLAILAILVSGLPETVFLFPVLDRAEPMLVEEDPRLCDLLMFELVRLDESGLIALRQPYTRLFLSCEPAEIGGKLTASRHLVSDWERFRLDECSPDDDALTTDPRLELLRAFVRGPRNLGHFLAEHREDKLDVLCSIFPALLCLVGKDERQELKVRCGAASRYIF